MHSVVCSVSVLTSSSCECRVSPIISATPGSRARRWRGIARTLAEERARLLIRNLNKMYDEVPVVKDVNLEIRDKEFLVLGAVPRGGFEADVASLEATIPLGRTGTPEDNRRDGSGAAVRSVLALRHRNDDRSGWRAGTLKLIPFHKPRL